MLVCAYGGGSNLQLSMSAFFDKPQRFDNWPDHAVANYALRPGLYLRA